MRAVFARLLYEIEKGGDCVIVTLVRCEGSAPRGAGSMMLVTAKGRAVGSVGGGALEKRCEDMAMALIPDRRSALHTFKLSPNPQEDIGMVCGGEVTALFQFVGADDAEWTALAGSVAERFDAKRPATLALRLDGGLPALIGENEALPAQEGTFRAKLETGERAVIFGGGHIALALCPILKSVGFRPVVYDDRPDYALAERFPEAESVVLGDYGNIADSLTLLPDDYIVVMTNGHLHDLEVQFQALARRQSYIGVIGSARKKAAINARLMEMGVPESRLNDVHTPIGTAIKAVTPSEIAVSIAGEMIMVRAQSREGKNY